MNMKTNPSYFDVDYRSTKFWPIQILIYEDIGESIIYTILETPFGHRFWGLLYWGKSSQHLLDTVHLWQVRASLSRFAFHRCCSDILNLVDVLSSNYLPGPELNSFVGNAMPLKRVVDDIQTWMFFVILVHPWPMKNWRFEWVLFLIFCVGRTAFYWFSY